MNSKTIQNILSCKNRTTTASSAILDCFHHYNEPIDYSQIMTFLSDNLILVNKTTVYRQLNHLQKIGVIQELDLGEGKKRYEINLTHHHHIRCTNCNKIECIKLPDGFDRQLAEISKLTKFKITGHTIEITGLCKQCQRDK